MTSAGYIRPELAHLAVPIGEVSPYPGNPRRGDRDRIAVSLDKHGQYAPLLVQASTGHIVKGNNTLSVMAELGWTHVAVLRLEIDDDRARHLLMIDNRSSDSADYDTALLTDLLAGVVDWDAAGWSPADLDELMAELANTGDLDLEQLAAAVEPVTLPPSTTAAAPAVPPPPTLPPPPSTPPPPPVPAATAPATPLKPQPAAAPLMTEWTLLYTRTDRDEARRLVDAARDWLGRDLTPSDIVMRALRTLAVVGDIRHDPHATVRVGSLLLGAGHNPLEPRL